MKRPRGRDGLLGVQGGCGVWRTGGLLGSGVPGVVGRDLLAALLLVVGSKSSNLCFAASLLVSRLCIFIAFRLMKKGKRRSKENTKKAP